MFQTKILTTKMYNDINKCITIFIIEEKKIHPVARNCQYAM